MKNKIVIFDFGSQTCHLIGRRIRDFGIEAIIANPENFSDYIFKEKPAGIIFSGGPSSVYEKNAPTIDKKIFDLNIPILGICYGLHLIAYLLKGKVKQGTKKEFGPAKLKIFSSLPLLESMPNNSMVWMSHGDEIVKLPAGFKSFAKTTTNKNTVIANPQRKIYAVQFHPEVQHTKYGSLILKNFVGKICGLPIKKKKIEVTKIVQQIREKVGQEIAVGAVSGGTDSTIAALLCIKAIGKNFLPVYVHSGLMRKEAKESVREIFSRFGVKPRIVEASQIFLKKLKGITDPEQKRKIIGNLYFQLIKKEVKKIPKVKFFAQGTIYSDVIESKGTSKADKIKSHHNVGGLPAKLGLELLEPLRNFYTDEVREIGKKLKLPKAIINKQPFPGPGHAIRIIGEVTPERLKKQQLADQIVLEELGKAGWLNRVFQSFPIMTGVRSTAVKGDARFWGEVVALRIYTSKDRMTADWARIPEDLLQKISSRIVNEVPNISRVVYDISTKPPATMEWE